MENNVLLSEVPQLIASRQLRKAITVLRTYVTDHPFDGAMDVINGIENDYRLMLDYARQGYSDPSREQLYVHLQKRLYRLCQAMRIREAKDRLLFFSDADATISSGSLTDVRTKERLEDYVSGLAMLSLESEEERKEKAAALYRGHHALLNELFSRLIVSFPWSDGDQKFYEDLLLSPTIDRMDVMVLVSALMLSTIQTFDVQKFATLLHVYLRTNDEYIRQRALVGWTFALGSDEQVTDEPTVMVRDACQDPKVVQDVLDLQKQLVYCINTRQDNEKIQQDIIPTLMKNQNFTISRDGIITEKEDHSLEDILNPNAEEERMEEMEESIQKMVEMQKAGSDIYFGGFSHMKRFPFFHKAVNWFCPFYVEHPALSGISDKLGTTGFMSNLVQHGPFCDSDKYSFVLALSSIVDRLPNDIKEMMGSAEALGPMMDEEQMKDATYIRRMYLQDQYRFYSLYDRGRGLQNPFANDRIVFVSHPAFQQTDVAKRFPDLCVFFAKHRCAEAFRQLQEASMPYLDLSHRLFYALWSLDSGQVQQAITLLEEVLREQPDHEQAKRYLARAYYQQEDFQRACAVYEELYQSYPEKSSYALNYGITLSKNGRFDDAVRVLFQLDFEHPSQHVTRGLAWALMGQKKLDQAEREYEKLLETETAPIDYLNAGYCQWLKGNIRKAVEAFRTFLKLQQETGNQVDLHEEMMKDQTLLRAYSISDIDMGIMCDVVVE